MPSLVLTIGVIISIPMYNLQIPVVNSLLPILVMIILGYLGFRMGTTRIEEWKKSFFTPRQKESKYGRHRRTNVGT